MVRLCASMTSLSGGVCCVTVAIVLMVFVDLGASEFDMLTSSNSAQGLFRITCQVKNTPNAAETLIYLGCPFVDSQICYTNCSAACHHVGSTCNVVDSLYSLLHSCSFQSKQDDELTVVYNLRSEHISVSGKWYCIYRGQNSRSIDISKWTAPDTTSTEFIPTTLITSTSTSTSTGTSTTSSPPPPPARATAGKEWKQRGKDNNYPDDEDDNNSDDNDGRNVQKGKWNSPYNNRDDSDTNRGKESQEASVLSVITRKEMILVTLSLLAVSLFLNLFLCIRCVLVKTYIDAFVHQGKVQPCTERCLCLSCVGSAPAATPYFVDRRLLELSAMASVDGDRRMHYVTTAACSPAFTPYMYPATPASLSMRSATPVIYPSPAAVRRSAAAMRHHSSSGGGGRVIRLAPGSGTPSQFTPIYVDMDDMLTGSPPQVQQQMHGAGGGMMTYPMTLSMGAGGGGTGSLHNGSGSQTETLSTSSVLMDCPIRHQHAVHVGGGSGQIMSMTSSGNNNNNNSFAEPLDPLHHAQNHHPYHHSHSHPLHAHADPEEDDVRTPTQTPTPTMILMMQQSVEEARTNSNCNTMKMDNGKCGLLPAPEAFQSQRNGF